VLPSPAGFAVAPPWPRPILEEPDPDAPRCLFSPSILLKKIGGVQIDHVVARSDCWQKGAQHWCQSWRAAVANEPLNLLATSDAVNESKGDGDTATWLPPNRSYRCAYVARQVTVKTRYQLRVTAVGKTAMTRVLSTCPNQPLLTQAAATRPEDRHPTTVARKPATPPTPRTAGPGTPLPHLQSRQPGRIWPAPARPRPRRRLVSRRRPRRPRLRKVARPTKARASFAAASQPAHWQPDSQKGSSPARDGHS